MTVEVTAAVRHASAILDLLPPGASPASQRPERGRFALVTADVPGLLNVVCDSLTIGPVDAAVALSILDSQIRLHVALNAPDHFFVHAGVVGSRDRAIVLPGKSFAGKTTLVAALVRAGAEYWSDECAVLDIDGRVHPYAKPLSVRTGENRIGEARTIQSLGGRAGDHALELGLIAIAHYRLGGLWAPRVCTPGEGAIKLLEHTIPARSRPEQALTAVRRAASGAVVLEGERGEAEMTATALMAVLSGSTGS